MSTDCESSDSESSDSAITCGVAGCVENAAERTSCCREPLCEAHSAELLHVACDNPSCVLHEEFICDACDESCDCIQCDACKTWSHSANAFGFVTYVAQCIACPGDPPYLCDTCYKTHACLGPPSERSNADTRRRELRRAERKKT